MSRAPRVDVGDEIYHIINRTNGRIQIFNSKEDYLHFENLLREAQKLTDMRIIAYTIMPNHWHLVLYPRHDRDLSVFMQWLTLTHTQQYHVRKNTVGYGHIYQGRYKSFLVSKDNYLLQLIRYVEQNPLRAKLVKKAEDWQWGSAWRRYYLNKTKDKGFLSNIPIDLPNNYRIWLNQLDENDDLEEIRLSVEKGKPFGTMKWVDKMVEKFKLLSTTRNGGRPKNST